MRTQNYFYLTGTMSFLPGMRDFNNGHAAHKPFTLKIAVLHRGVSCLSGSWKTAHTEMKNPVWSTSWPATTAIRPTSAKPGAQRSHALRNMRRTPTSGTDASTCRPRRTTRSSTNTAFHSKLFRSSTTSPVLPIGEWKWRCTSAQKRTRWTKTRD